MIRAEADRPNSAKKNSTIWDRSISGANRSNPPAKSSATSIPKLKKNWTTNHIWFDTKARVLIGAAFADVTARRNYTIWACFIGANHAHLCIRYHRDKYETMHEHLAAQSRTSLANAGITAPAHPVWAKRPYSVYQHAPQDVHRTIRYVENNAAKEGLPKQIWSFVCKYHP